MASSAVFQVDIITISEFITPWKKTNLIRIGKNVAFKLARKWILQRNTFGVPD